MILFFSVLSLRLEKGNAEKAFALGLQAIKKKKGLQAMMMVRREWKKDIWWSLLWPPEPFMI